MRLKIEDGAGSAALLIGFASAVGINVFVFGTVVPPKRIASPITFWVAYVVWAATAFGMQLRTVEGPRKGRSNRYKRRAQDTNLVFAIVGIISLTLGDTGLIPIEIPASAFEGYMMGFGVWALAVVAMRLIRRTGQGDITKKSEGV
jgi:hypothetical protein